MLEKLIATEVYHFFLVFARVGAAFMFMPGFSAAYFIQRSRLSLALAICVVLTPSLSSILPQMPTSPFELGLDLFFEISVGVFLGIVMQTMFAALHLAGNKLSMAIGFGAAMAFDPTTANQSAIINSVFSIIAITLIFVTDLHHLMLGAVFDSYSLFKSGVGLPVDDFSKYLSLLLTKGFHIGFQLAAPFIVFSYVIYTGMGIITKLMPQLHIFFVTLPLQILLGTSLLAMAISTIMMYFLQYYEKELIAFLTPV